MFSKDTRSLLMLLAASTAFFVRASLPYGGKVPDYVYYQPASVAQQGNCGVKNPAIPCSPKYWNSSSSGNPTCGASYTSQSPINVVTKTVIPDSTLKELVLSVAHHCEELRLLNNNHTFEIDYAECIPTFNITWGGLVYQLAQFHFHTPSENTIDGKFFDAEVHLVHKNRQNPKKIVVIGVLLNIVSATTDFFYQFFNKAFTGGLGSLISSTTEDKFNPYDALLPAPRSYYTFAGSLTTPPCTVKDTSGTEYPVTWILMKNPMSVSAAFVKNMNTSLIQTPGSQVGPTGANNRPVQPIGTRKISLFNATSKATTTGGTTGNTLQKSDAPKTTFCASAAIVCMLAIMLV